MNSQQQSVPHLYQIAIDGLSSCGKSTLAKDLAEEFQIIHVDTGLMYRAITHSILSHEIPPKDGSAITHFLNSLDFKIQVENRKQYVYINQQLLNTEVRSKQVDQLVSDIAQISSVRQFLVKQQQRLANLMSVVMDGRDIGTVVLPNANVKLYMQADLFVRAQRRFSEKINLKQTVTLEDVTKNLSRRDQIDSTRQDSPLTKAHDAVLLDTTNLTRKEQLRMASALIRERIRM